MQLSLIPALEAARISPRHTKSQTGRVDPSTEPMAPPNRPTPAQVSYLKRLTGIRSDSQLARYVARRVNECETTGSNHKPGGATLTRRDFAKVIDLEMAMKRWTN